MTINKKNASYILLLLGCLLVNCTLHERVKSYSTSEIQQSNLEVNASKKTYMLGEEAEFEFQIQDRQPDFDAVQKSKNIRCGYLKVQIASEDKIYKDYFGPKWQTEDCEVALPLKENASFKITKKLLWNVKPEVFHLNPNAAKRVSEHKILTDYVFPKAGLYFVRAVLSFSYNQSKIESEPIQITIKEPVGEDMEVWNIIKNDGNFAYFIQQGSVLNLSKPEEKVFFQKEIEQIINQYPGSFYTPSLRRSLEKFKVDGEKRKIFLQKIEKEKQPK